jgi:hypothetical protein
MKQDLEIESEGKGSVSNCRQIVSDRILPWTQNLRGNYEHR